MLALRLRLPTGWRPLTCALGVVVMLAAGCTAASPPATTASGDAAGSSPAEQPADSMEALQAAIAGIDAAVYAYGVVGAHLPSSGQAAALRAIATLDRQRAGFELALGSPVPEAGVAYAIAEPVTNATQARALAELLEMKLIPLFDQVAGTTSGATRALAANASRKSAQRAQAWRT